MSDNLKTWPESVSFLTYGDTNGLDFEISTEIQDFEHVNFGRVIWIDTKKVNSELIQVKYIRTDIAKQREAKLIKAAFYFSDLHPNCDLGERAEIYKAAGLEELK
jgi:hypothetical protein